MQLKDHYRTLRITREASQEDIKAAYRGLAKKYHPDKNHGNKIAEETFKEIQEAYSILSDPEKKRKYDLRLKYGEPGPQRSSNNNYRKREQPKQKRDRKRSSTRSTADQQKEKNERKSFVRMAAGAGIFIVACILYSYFNKTDYTVPKPEQIVQAKVDSQAAIPSISNADSPYDNVFGESVYDTLSRNRIYLYNKGNCPAIICLVESKAPFRTIRNEYIESQIKFVLDIIPDGEYFLKIYYGNNWVPRGLLPDGTMAGRFTDEKGFRIYNSDAIKMQQSSKGGLLTFSSYEFQFSVNDTSGSKSLTAEQFFQ